MSDCINTEQQQALCKRMASNLSTLRAKLNLSQEELAERLGFSRQTISAIENQKREMQWSTFSAITLFLTRDEEIRDLMRFMEIINDDVCEMLNIY